MGHQLLSSDLTDLPTTKIKNLGGIPHSGLTLSIESLAIFSSLTLLNKIAGIDVVSYKS